MRKKVNVAHFFVVMDRGGAETFVMNLFRAIDREKVNFSFILTSDAKGSYDDEIRKLGGEIYILPSPSKDLSKYKKELFKLLKEKRFDVVHSHLHYFSGVNLSVAKKAGIGMRIAHSHNISDGVSNSFVRNVYRKYMLHNIKKNATNLFACGEEAAKALYGNKDDNRIKIVNNGIDIEKFMYNHLTKEECREKLGLPKGAYIIGNVARFEKQKNHEFLIDIFYKVQKENDNAYLVLVGDGTLKEMIHEKVKALSIDDKVIFLGVREDINVIMKSLDIFLFPSLYEGLGIVVIEAQATGIKCVVSDTVPKEVDLTGNVSFIPLDSNLDVWTEEVLTKGRLNEVKNVMEKYNINNIAKELCNIYTGNYNKE